jgi:hypothetical protein
MTVPFVWMNQDINSDFTLTRSFLVPQDVADRLFAIMRVMERGIANEKPRGYFTCGSEHMDTTTLTAELIIDLLRAFKAKPVP